MPLALPLTTILRRLLDLVLLALILIVLAALVTARVIPTITGAPTYVVSGGSMEPTIPLGSLIVTERVTPSVLQVGNVVSLEVGARHEVFTHRITRLVTHDGDPWIQTKGDANAAPDPSIVAASAVTGRVSLIIPGLGYVVRMLSTISGVTFLVTLGLLTLLGAWLLEILEDDQRASRVARRHPVAAMAVEHATGPGGAG